MTSLYGTTRYFDYGYLQHVIYGDRAPTESDDCSGASRQPFPCQQPLVTVEPVGIAGWLKQFKPRWYALLVRAQLSYVLDNDLTARTLFLPPDDMIDRYQIEQWNYGLLRRLFCRFIVDRPISPRYLRRSLGYKLYTFENYDPVYIFSMDGRQFFFQSPSCAILDTHEHVPIQSRQSAGYTDRAFTGHWIHFLSGIPSIEDIATVYAD